MSALTAEHPYPGGGNNAANAKLMITIFIDFTKEDKHMIMKQCKHCKTRRMRYDTHCPLCNQEEHDEVII